MQVIIIKEDHISKKHWETLIYYSDLKLIKEIKIFINIKSRFNEIFDENFWLNKMFDSKYNFYNSYFFTYLKINSSCVINNLNNNFFDICWRRNKYNIKRDLTKMKFEEEWNFCAQFEIPEVFGCFTRLIYRFRISIEYRYRNIRTSKY